MLYNLGKFVMTPRGEYSANATYDALDFFYYPADGCSYVCKSNGVTGVLPTNTTYFQKLSNAATATMTAEQQQAIINAIIAEGVVVDPDYNTYTDAEKAKLATLSVPNAGTLTINQNGRTLATFGANQSGNTTVTLPSIPTVNNGKITLVNRADGTEIDSFYLNQKEDQSIALPIESGSGTVGTLTLAVDGSTVGTWTANAAGTIDLPGANSGTLTIKRNNVAVATFGANSSTNVNANITVPTATSEMSDYGSLVHVAVVDYSDQSGVIDKLEPNTAYYMGTINALEVQSYKEEQRIPDSLATPPSYIYFTAERGVTVTAPADSVITDNGIDHTNLSDGDYIAKIRGNIWIIELLKSM